MGRMPVPLRLTPFQPGRCRPSWPWGITRRFHRLSPRKGLVAYALRTRAPLSLPRREDPVRLACIRPAASVHPEPGSKSSLSYCCTYFFFLLGLRYVLAVPYSRNGPASRRTVSDLCWPQVFKELPNFFTTRGCFRCLGWQRYGDFSYPQAFF